MRISRSENLNPFGTLDVTGETILRLLAVQSQSRQLRYATLVHFGDDEMMPGDYSNSAARRYRTPPAL